MGMKKTLGGDRLGSGKRMKVELHGYERSTHNMGYLWRSTMSAGTLVPCICEVALPGDTFDIELNAEINTHPTVGPLFGGYKVQVDTFLCPMRLYQGKLHNNKLGIGLNMESVKLPQLRLGAVGLGGVANIPEDLDNSQINPSCILSYLGIRGVGDVSTVPIDEMRFRDFNAVPLLAYWDIYKNYYANKQEENGWVIHRPTEDLVNTVTILSLNFSALPFGVSGYNTITPQAQFQIAWAGTIPLLNQIILHTAIGDVLLSDMLTNVILGNPITGNWNSTPVAVYGWGYVTTAGVLPVSAPIATPFPLSDIDDMREALLTQTTSAAAVIIGGAGGAMDLIEPYSMLLKTPVWLETSYRYTQEGLGLKTYQSDLFNNWLNEEFIDGVNGINEITAIDTSSGSFNIDTIVLSKKVYDMLNRIAVSGGTYDDWLDAVYTHDRYVRMETPVYQGGLIRELVFQEVVSNSESSQNSSDAAGQPLGTLGGKGVMSGKRKGGSVTIKVDEPSYIIGIISLTPRIDYSQGNKWDVHLKTMDDLHKPALDEIGFQDLITEQMAWWDTTNIGVGTTAWEQHSAGKQPAWLNYMTNVNQTRGNFADVNNEMFMTLNRRYEHESTVPGARIKDLTTYIDPVKFNYSFAQTALDAQNFWAQMSIDMTVRRKMSAKLMPNL